MKAKRGALVNDRFGDGISSLRAQRPLLASGDLAVLHGVLHRLHLDAEDVDHPGGLFPPRRRISGIGIVLNS